jgi:hypothetical protein
MRYRSRYGNTVPDTLVFLPAVFLPEYFLKIRTIFMKKIHRRQDKKNQNGYRVSHPMPSY